jgi:Sec-independent protein translocase protein TatA
MNGYGWFSILIILVIGYVVGARFPGMARRVGIA